MRSREGKNTGANEERACDEILLRSPLLYFRRKSASDPSQPTPTRISVDFVSPEEQAPPIPYERACPGRRSLELALDEVSPSGIRSLELAPTIKSRHVGMEDEVVLGATGIITIEVQVLLPVD